MNRKRPFDKPPLWIATRQVHFNKDLRYQPPPDTERLLYEVADRSTISNKFDQTEEAYSCILANLLHADVMNAPLVYSRNSNAYVIERKRYGYDFYTYKTVIRLVDTMYEMGLVQGVKGRRYGNGRCRSSKIWATEKLLDRLSLTGGKVFIKPNKEVLFLKDEDKRLQDYPESNLSRAMRKQLHEFNEMLGALDISFTLDYPKLSDRAKSRVNKLCKLLSLSLSNQIVTPDSNPLGMSDRVREYTGKAIPTKYYIVLDHDAFLLNKLGGLPIILNINRDVNTMRRIFNLDWCHGGRFYHAPHTTMPSACRKTMVINGEPTVELDYSGLHIRMLYHRIGLDYQDECYVYDKTDKDNRIDRERMKLASLIVINSDDRQKAIKAIHDQCRKKDIHYPAGQSGSYSALVDRFEEYHEPIKEFFLKGKGLELQYLDSTIMASILERMTRKGIPALPVHDSVICPARHESSLHQVMVEEYEKVMGFKPVIG